jgi:hypothetical protein
MGDIITPAGKMPELWTDEGDSSFSRNVRIRAGSEVDISDRIGRLVGRITNYDVLVNSTLGASGEYVEIDCSGLGTVGIGISGTWAGTITAYVQAGDGVWDTIPLIDNTLGGAALNTTVNGNFVVGVSGALALRLVMDLYTSGTATVYLEGTSAAGGVFLTRSIPTGLNSIGTVGLDAGTETIGKLAANDGIDIGNVDVGELTTTVINTTKSATGDNEIVAAPGADVRIVVLSFLMQNESSTATTMILRSAATTNGWRYLGQSQGDSLSMVFSLARPWKLGTNEALNLNLDGANSCGMSVAYYTESV